LPADPADEARTASFLERFGELVPAPRGVAVRLRTGQADLAEIVRALDAENLSIDQLQLHQPSLDDVFLAKTGRSLEGAGDDEDSQPAALAMDPA
jgi:ABC-2 type transport system ATP-binding protein